MFQSNIYCVYVPNKIIIYITTIDIASMKKEVKLESGPVHYGEDEYKIYLLNMGYENWCVASIFWK